MEGVHIVWNVAFKNLREWAWKLLEPPSYQGVFHLIVESFSNQISDQELLIPIKGRPVLRDRFDLSSAPESFDILSEQVHKLVLWQTLNEARHIFPKDLEYASLPSLDETFIASVTNTPWALLGAIYLSELGDNRLRLDRVNLPALWEAYETLNLWAPTLRVLGELL